MYAFFGGPMPRYRRSVNRLLAPALIVGSVFLPHVASATSTISLLLPQSSAFTVLGHSCGGIQEQSSASGFNATTGVPTGVVYLQTRCGASGRGGGYHVTTYSAWVSVTWDFAGSVLTTTTLASAPALNDSSFTTTDVLGDTLANHLNSVNVQPVNCTVQNVSYCSYRAVLTDALAIVASAPLVTQTGDNLTVTWTAAANVAASTVSASPAGGGSSLISTVVGTAGSATIVGVQPSTQYSVSVVSTNAAGNGLPSPAILFKTEVATVRPSAPPALRLLWSSAGTTLEATWQSSLPGDAPIDSYQLRLARHDPNGLPAYRLIGLATTFSQTGIKNIYDWSVQVRAHNAAGWGPWCLAKILVAY